MNALPFDINDACGCEHLGASHAYEAPHDCCRYGCGCRAFKMGRRPPVPAIVGRRGLLRDWDADGRPVDPPPFSEPLAPPCPHATTAAFRYADGRVVERCVCGQEFAPGCVLCCGPERPGRTLVRSWTGAAVCERCVAAAARSVATGATFEDVRRGPAKAKHSCSLCGKSQREVRTLIASNTGAAVCDECVTESAAMLPEAARVNVLVRLANVGVGKRTRHEWVPDTISHRGRKP